MPQVAAAATPSGQKGSIEDFINLVDRAWDASEGSWVKKSVAVWRAVRENYGLTDFVRAIARGTTLLPSAAAQPSPVEDALVNESQPVVPQEDVTPDADGNAEPRELPAEKVEPMAIADSGRLGQYIEGLAAQTAAQENDLVADVRRNRTFAKVVLVTLIVTGVVAVVLLVVGAVLVFTGVVAVGAVSAVLGIFPAAGTALLWRLEARLGRARRELDEQRKRNRADLAAVQGIYAIDDLGERRRKYDAYVDQLKDRSARSSPV